jgi:acetyl esterase/lipase
MKEKINEIREMFNKHGEAFAKIESVIITKRSIDNIDCFWFENIEQRETKQLIIYLHGGAFTLGGIISHGSLITHLTNKFNLPILFIEYSLAPENPYPTALNEVIKVYQSILEKHSQNEIIFMGDSAGAGLAISVISKLNELKIKPPHSLVMISPWVDLTCSFESHTTNANSDTIFGGKRDLLQNMGSLYADKESLVAVSPIQLMTGVFPSTLIMVGSTEVLLDDSKAVYSKILENQPNAKLSIYDSQKHVWLFEDIHTETSKMTMNEIEEFITKK